MARRRRSLDASSSDEKDHNSNGHHAPRGKNGSKSESDASSSFDSSSDEENDDDDDEPDYNPSKGKPSSSRGQQDESPYDSFEEVNGSESGRKRAPRTSRTEFKNVDAELYDLRRSGRSQRAPRIIDDDDDEEEEVKKTRIEKKI